MELLSYIMTIQGVVALLAGQKGRFNKKEIREENH